MKFTSYPPSLQKLITQLSKLPSIGLRSAERLALHLVRSEPTVSEELVQAVREAREKVRHCRVCGHLTEKPVCEICEDPARERSKICVVEQTVDVLSLERSGSYGGLYHVLGGKLSPLNKVGPENLRITPLLSRLEGVSEVILALPADVEGDVTATYIARELRDKGVRTTRIAMGLPAGGGLDFADSLTLSHAIQGRKDVATT